jgi:hypothetical protein
MVDFEVEESTPGVPIVLAEVDDDFWFIIEIFEFEFCLFGQ